MKFIMEPLKWLFAIATLPLVFIVGIILGMIDYYQECKDEN